MSALKNKIFLFIISLLFVEIGSYFLLYFFTNYDLNAKPLEIFNDESDILSFEVKKNFSQRFVHREFNVLVKTNNIGLRENQPYHGEKIDIAFAGDSFVFGHGVNVNERFSDLIRPHFPKKRILALTYLNGWTTPHYYIFLKHNPKLVPRLLVMELYLGCDLRSDIQETHFIHDESGELVSAKSSKRFVDSRGRFISPNSWAYSLLNSFYIGKVVSLAYVIIKNQFIAPAHGKKSGNPHGFIDPFYQGIINDTTGLEYILKTREYLKEKGSELIVFIIPESFMIGQYVLCPYNDDVCEEIKNRKLLQKSVRRWLSNHNIEFIDPTDYFIELERNGTRLYFEQDEHWNTQGHKAAANILHRYLAENDKVN